MCAHYGCNHCAPLPCACDSPRLAAQFFSNATAKARGLQVVRKMMAWYKGLAVDLQSTVDVQLPARVAGKRPLCSPSSWMFWMVCLHGGAAA